MNLSHLQYFRELAQVQHYTKAAHNLFISQPTLSHSIAALEDELGVKLFEKNGRTVKLTDDGALFARYVERSLDVLEDGIGELEKRKGRLSGTVHLGAIHSVRSAFLPEAVLAYRRTHKRIARLPPHRRKRPRHYFRGKSRWLRVHAALPPKAGCHRP